MPEYDPKRGPVRNWLFTVTCNMIGNVPLGEETPAWADSWLSGPFTPRPCVGIRLGYRVRAASSRSTAVNRVKREFHSSIWQAFWKAAVEGRPAPDVGRELKMPTGTVYVVKSQVLVRFNEEVQRLRAEAW